MNEVVYDDSDEDCGVAEENSCFACLGNENWDLGEAWIGCSNRRCSKWFHKSCLSVDVSRMSTKEIEDFEFFCKLCEKKRKP